MRWIGEGLEGNWGIPVLLSRLMGGWRWQAVGWEVTSVWSLLTEEGNCLQGPKMKQNLSDPCSVLHSQMSLGL